MVGLQRAANPLEPAELQRGGAAARGAGATCRSAGLVRGGAIVGEPVCEPGRLPGSPRVSPPARRGLPQARAKEPKPLGDAVFHVGVF